MLHKTQKAEYLELLSQLDNLVKELAFQPTPNELVFLSASNGLLRQAIAKVDEITRIVKVK